YSSALAETSEYPQASRYAPAAPGNYRHVTGTRDIKRVVIHITDGGSKTNGTVGWFQNTNQLNANGKHITVSAHYVVGQDVERADRDVLRSEEHTSELQSLAYLVCR